MTTEEANSIAPSTSAVAGTGNTESASASGNDGNKNAIEKRPANSEETNASSSSSAEKRARTTSTDVNGNDKKEVQQESKSNGEDVLDLARVFGFKTGDRLEVQWEIEDNNEGIVTTTSHWWGATLLEHDGRTEDSVAIRVLDYDPYPEGGFPERSLEDVIFIGQDQLVSPTAEGTEDYLHFRREGTEGGSSEESVIWYNENDLNQTLNGILMGALKNHKHAWDSLSAAQQAKVGEVIAAKKEKLMEVLKDQEGVITSSSIQEILSQAFN